MIDVLEEVLIKTEGGTSRARILHSLSKRPRNANRLAGVLGMAYKTVRHHLDVLVDHGLIRASGPEYGAVYLLTEQARHSGDQIEEFWREQTCQ